MKRTNPSFTKVTEKGEITKQMDFKASVYLKHMKPLEYKGGSHVPHHIHHCLRQLKRLFSRRPSPEDHHFRSAGVTQLTKIRRSKFLCTTPHMRIGKLKLPQERRHSQRDRGASAHQLLGHRQAQAPLSACFNWTHDHLHFDPKSEPLQESQPHCGRT